MKKIFLLLGIIVATMQAYAQAPGSIGANIPALDADQNVQQYQVNKLLGTPQSILFYPKSTYSTFSSSLLPEDPFDSLLKKYFALRPGIDALVKNNTTTTVDNITVVSYLQYFKNIRVEFGAVTTTASDGQLVYISSQYYNVPANTSINPTITEPGAFTIALQSVGATTYSWETKGSINAAINLAFNKKPTGQLVLVAAPNSAVVRLAYKFDIYATNPISRSYVYVDAQNGNIILTTQLLENTNSTGTASTMYSGTVPITTNLTLSPTTYTLNEVRNGVAIGTYNLANTTGPSAFYLSNSTNNWLNTNPIANGGDGATDAHWGAEVTLDYWRNNHARNSYDNAGSTLNSFVHFALNYDNAYWDGSEMVYGDGSWNGTSGNFSTLTTLDICGHEIGHGVYGSIVGVPDYYQESGAIDESFSDIWAACIKNYANLTYGLNKNLWLIGSEVDHIAPGYLRSMSNPQTDINAYGHPDPDTYHGLNWVSTVPVPDANANDYDGVHENSGVMNKFFFLLTEGGSGTNDIGSVYNVTGITFGESEKITYLAELNLKASDGFAETRTAFVNAAIALYGHCSPEDIATTDAWYAVGVGDKHSSCTCPGDIIITGPYNVPITESQSWIKSNSTTTVDGSVPFVKLDADPDAGFVELDPGFSAQALISSEFVAQAFNGCDEGVENRPAIVVTPVDVAPVVPTDNTVTKNELVISPNPVMDDHFTVSADFDLSDASIELFDVNGKEQSVSTSNISTTSKNVYTTTLTKGIYIVKVTGSFKRYLFSR